MNAWVAVLAVALAIFIIITAKLRSDLCEARWAVYRLSYMILFQNESTVEYWAAPDPAKMAAYAQGQLTLEELLMNVRAKITEPAKQKCGQDRG